MRQAWKHANDDNVSIPTPIVSLLFLLQSYRYDASFHMFHTNIRHELCLHGGMVLEKAKMGVGGPERSRKPESGRFNHINGRIWSHPIEGASTSRMFSSNHIRSPCIKTYSWKRHKVLIIFRITHFSPLLCPQSCVSRFHLPNEPKHDE